MITALRKKQRVDTLINEPRTVVSTWGRKFYLGIVLAGIGYLCIQLMGSVLFLKADGLVLKNRIVMSPLYHARVVGVHVSAGDYVEAGQKLLTLQSTEMLDRLADVMGRKGVLLTREAQIRTRLSMISAMLPMAIERRERTMYTASVVGNLARRQLTTQPRQSEASRDNYEAEREEQQLSTEFKALQEELSTLAKSREEIESLSDNLKTIYNNGVVNAATSGTIGARIPQLGQVVKAADSALELYHGSSFVLAYVPTNRLYQVEVGERVVVTEGSKRYHGRVERIEGVTDAIPPEFQSFFQSVDRQQVVRITFEQAPPFPIQAKVQITSSYSPTDLYALTKAGIGAMGRLMSKI